MNDEVKGQEELSALAGLLQAQKQSFAFIAILADQINECIKLTANCKNDVLKKEEGENPAHYCALEKAEENSLKIKEDLCFLIDSIKKVHGALRI